MGCASRLMTGNSPMLFLFLTQYNIFMVYYTTQGIVPFLVLFLLVVFIEISRSLLLEQRLTRLYPRRAQKFASKSYRYSLPETSSSKSFSFTNYSTFGTGTTAIHDQREGIARKKYFTCTAHSYDTRSIFLHGFL